MNHFGRVAEYLYNPYWIVHIAERDCVQYVMQNLRYIL